ncbi:MAG TPA: hypothetical protein VK480_09735 [Solirubrobacterales bacterium]|nr:hypothetical protein [Solirubrobacterales bacterium]
MKRIVWPLAALALIAALIAGGCGDSANSDDQALTKKQFVRLTEGFCNKEYRAEERDMEKYADEHGLLFGGGEPWEQEVLNEAVVFDYVRDKIAYFKSLPAPEGDEKEVRAMIEAFEDGLEKSEENPAALAEARPGKNPPSDYWDASYETTSSYGPWLCGQP